MSEKDEETEWVTQSDLAGIANSGGTSRRSSSSQRPMTAVSGSTRNGNLNGNGSKGNSLRSESLSREGSVGSRVGGSVRKRLSLLKLGKKSSKASVLVDSVVEEE